MEIIPNPYTNSTTYPYQINLSEKELLTLHHLLNPNNPPEDFKETLTNITTTLSLFVETFI